MSATCRPSVKSFVAAGQRMHVAQCGRCKWFGNSTSDKGTAMSEKAEHELNGTVAGVGS